MPWKYPWKINNDLLIYKSFYFFYFGALGAINPFLPVYLRQIGLSAFAVGLLVGIRPIVQLASAPFWTVVADKFRKRKAILVMSIMAWLIMTIALVFVEPTEEICEFTAKNSSHSVFVNYTKHKTGFFKKSTERPVAMPVRLTRSMATNTFRSNNLTSLSVDIRKHFKKIAKDYGSTFKLKEPDFRKSLNPRHYKSTNLGVKAKSRKSKILTLANQLLHTGHRKLEKRNNEANDHSYLENMLSWTEKMENGLSRDFKSKNMSLPKNVSTTDVSSTSKVEAKVMHSSSDSQTSAEGSTEEQHKVFDPFNMNGKSESSAGAELAKFFATTHNQTSYKSTDVHYYNMNGAESVNKTPNAHSFKIKYKHEKQNPNRKLKTMKAKGNIKNVKTNLAEGLETSKHANETMKVVKTNLFKSNRNEMKRLFVILLVLIVVGEFLETPSAPLSDASLLEYLGEDRIHYGKQRLWGSLGHGIASFLVGMLLERSRHLTCGEEFIDYTTSFSVFTIFMLVTFVISANFSFRYKDVEEADNSVFSTVLSIHYISFLIAVCYMGMSHGLIHNFLMWFLEDLGGSKTLMGLSICSRNSADLIMFFIVSKLIEIFGQIKIVFISLISYGTIFIAYSTMSNPWFALGVEFLGGFTFAASWTACTSYLAEAAPQESVTTMQGILQGVYWGLGLGTGSILGGHLIHTLGPHWTFRAAASGSFVIASLFAVTQWRWKRENLDDSLGIYHYFSSAEPKDTEALLQKDNIDRTLKSSKNKDYRNVEPKRKVRREKQDRKHIKRENPQ